MYYHISISEQVRRIYKKCFMSVLQNQNNDKSNNELNKLKDIKDGRIYKSVLKSQKMWFEANKALTFTLNTDGICLCEKSNLSVWPVYLVINELPIEKRFCIENVIVAGNYLHYNLIANNDLKTIVFTRFIS